MEKRKKREFDCSILAETVVFGSQHCYVIAVCIDTKPSWESANIANSIFVSLE